MKHIEIPKIEQELLEFIKSAEVSDIDEIVDQAPTTGQGRLKQQHGEPVFGQRLRHNGRRSDREDGRRLHS